MYHALLLENLLDLVNVVGSVARSPARSTCCHCCEPRRARCSERSASGRTPTERSLSSATRHFGIAQTPRDLEHYAAGLGVEASGPAREGVLDAAGYVRLAAEPFTLIASVAGPMPAYQPGHAHCDALAFELSVGADRIVTDTGVAEYIPGELRDAVAPRARTRPSRSATRSRRRSGRPTESAGDQRWHWSASIRDDAPKRSVRGGRRLESSIDGSSKWTKLRWRSTTSSRGRRLRCAFIYPSRRAWFPASTDRAPRFTCRGVSSCASSFPKACAGGSPVPPTSPSSDGRSSAMLCWERRTRSPQRPGASPLPKADCRSRERRTTARHNRCYLTTYLRVYWPRIAGTHLGRTNQPLGTVSPDGVGPEKAEVRSKMAATGAKGFPPRGLLGLALRPHPVDIDRGQTTASSNRDRGWRRNLERSSRGFLYGRQHHRLRGQLPDDLQRRPERPGWRRRRRRL